MARGLTKPSIESGYSLSDEALSALQSGDVQALMDHHKARFGGWSMMADEDDDDSDDDDDSAGGGDDKKNKSGSDDDDSSGDDDDDDDDDADDSDKPVSRAEFDRMMKRMKAADQRADKAEKRLREIDDADKTDLQKANDRVEELEGQVGELTSTLQSERLNNAFLSLADGPTWHKPATALKLAQTDGYLEDVVSDDGTVDQKALASALKQLAKDHEYLVKPREGAGPSGEGGKGRSNNSKDDKAAKQERDRRAPALARRGR